MNSKSLLLPFFLCSLALAACAAPEMESPSKQEVAKLSGKSDLGVDLCELYLWYGDGICDSFCAQPDPDCNLDCPDVNASGVSYVSHEPLQCAALDFLCDEGHESFDNACGCGCVDTTPDTELCSDASAPEKRYVLHSLAQCAVSLIGCEEGESYFDDDCGCGCVEVTTPEPEPELCDDPSAPEKRYVLHSLAQCAVSLIGCDADEMYFEDDCGCGCVGVE